MFDRPLTWSFRMQLIRTNRLSILTFLAVASVIIGSTVGNCLIGDIWQNNKCKPTTVPVFGCDCPLGPGHNDRCEGTLPKTGNMYGGVSCQTESGSTCDYGSSENKNACGRVVMCPCLTCGQPLIMGCQNGCTVFNDKPPCLNSWGECTYVP